MQDQSSNWKERARARHARAAGVSTTPDAAPDAALDADQSSNWKERARARHARAAGATPQVATALPTPAPDPVANTWLDYIGASLYSFGSGATASVAALPDMVNKVGLDFALNYTEQGKEHMKRYREIFPAIPENELQVMVRDNALQALTTDVYGRKQAGKPTTVTEDIFLLSQVPVGIKSDLDKKVASYPSEVSESATVQTAGALGQIGGTVAIGAVSPHAAAASAFSQGFMIVYDESRRPAYNEQGQLVRDAASFGDAAVGGLIGGTATMALEPLGARLVTGVGRSVAAQKVVNVLNRWNSASGGAGSKMVDTLTGKAVKLTAEEQAEKVFTDIGKSIGRRVIGEAVDKPIVEAVGRVGRAYFSEWISEALEQIFTNLGIAYATKDELDLLKDVVNSGAIGGNAGAVLRTLIETVAGARARSASARTKITSVTTTPTGDIEHFDEDGNPKSIGPRIELRGSGNFGDPLVPGKYANQIINTRGQKDLPNYIPETVSERELAVVIAREEQVDMGLALTYARMAKDTVANKLRGQPLEPVFEPTIDPTNPYSWGELSEEQAAAKYNDEYDQFLKKLDAFNENEERRRIVAQEFGADFLGATTEGDQLRLMRSMEDGRYWLQVYGDPEQTDANGIPLLPGKMPPEKVAMFQQLWQKLFNEEFALQLMEQQMQAPEQVDVKVARPRAEAIELARSNIEIYKQLLEEQYRGTPVEAMFRSGAERNNWDRYLKRIREEENARRARAADYFLGVAEEEDARQQAEAKAAVERGDFGAIEGDRRNQILRGLTKEAQQRAADFRQAMESRPEFFAPPVQLRPPMRAPQEPRFNPSLDPTKEDTWPASITTEEQALAQYEAEQSQYETDLAQFRQAEAARKARIGTIVPPERGPVAGIKPQAPPAPGKDYPTADELASRFGQVEGGWRVLQDVDGAGAQVATEMSGRIDGEYEAVAYADNKPGAPIVGRHIVTGELRVWTLNQIKSLAEKRKSPEYRKQEGERVRAAIIAYQERARRAGTLVEPSAPAPAPTPTPAAAAAPTPASTTEAVVRPEWRRRIGTFFSGGGTVESMLGDVEHVLAVEFEKEIVDAYNAAHNTSFSPSSVFDANVDAIRGMALDLFHASPVCKNFSLAKMDLTKVNDDDMKSAQMVARVIRETAPPAFSLENVPEYENYAPFQEIVKALQDGGYKIRITVVNAADFGAPQNRRRLIVQAVKEGELPPLPQPTGPSDWYETIKDEIEKAPEDKIGPDEMARINSDIKAGRLDPTKPIITMGGSAFKGRSDSANAGGAAPTVKANQTVVRVLLPQPDGKFKIVRPSPRALARLQGLPDSYKLPSNYYLAKKIVGNGVHGVVTEKFIKPLLPSQKPAAPAIEPEPKSAINAQVRAMLDPNGNKKFVFVAEGSPQPDAELVASASAKVFRVDLTGENGGIKGVLYTTDRALMMRARRRSSEPGGVTETHLDQLLYNRAQGKPTSENAQVVQRRDKNGNVVASRATDPQDVPAVSQEFQRQVPEGTTTVATPAEELTERRAKAVSEQAEQQQTGRPLADRMKAAPTEVSTAVSSAIDSFVAQRSTETGADAAFLNPQRREILRTVLTRLSMKGDPQTINDILPHVPRQAGKAPSDVRMAVAEVLAYAEQSGLVVQQSMPGGMTYNSLTANSEQLIRREGAKQPKILPPDQPLFGKPKAKELPAKPTFVPVVGRVAPTVNPWKARVDAALASDPGLFEVITDEEFDLLDPTVAETQGNVRVATDEQLRLLIESETPAGLADVPTFVKDPVSGVDVVASTTLQTVRLDPKKTSVESWLVNRQLAWIELRRRAQAKILTGKLERTDRSLTKYPPKSGSTYGRPVDPADPSTHLDMDRPVGHIAGVDGKAVPLFEDGSLSLTVTDIPAVELAPIPISLVDINNQIRDMYNHISLPLEPLPELKGAAGIYDPKRHRAAVESAWDYGTIAHEFMHGMVAWCYASGGDGPTSLVAKMPTSVIGEVTDLGRKLYGSEPAGGFEHEGLAEFFKIWMLRNESARLHYPATTLWFEGEVLRIDRQLGDKIVAAQKIVDQFRFQGEEARNRATALSEEQRRKKVPLLRRIAVRRFWDKFIQNYFSPYYGQAAPGGSQKMARKIARERGMSIEEAENAIELNPQTYMENLAGQAGNLLRKWTTDHMTLADGFTINSDVMSLEQAMMPMSGSRADLEMYIQLRRQEWLMNQDEPRMGPSLARDLSGLERLRRKHGESIDIAYQNVMKWIRQGVMQYVRDNDPVFSKALADIEASGDVETWVPFQRIVWEVTANPDPFSGALRRAMDPARVAPEIGKGPTERMSKEMVGGIAPIEPVFESLERNLHALIVAVHKRKLLQMGSDLAKMDPRLRYICYEIRGAVDFTGEGYASDPILNLTENQALMQIQGINAMPDVNNPDRILISRNVLAEDGTLRPVVESWHREWIEAISAMSPKHWESSNTSLQVLLWMARASTKATKMVATGVLSPAFSLLRGPLMDFQTIYHNGTFGYTGYDLFYQYALRYLQLGVADPLLKLGTGKPGATTQLERSANVMFESTPFMGFSSRSYFKYVGLSKGQRAAEMAKIWNGDLGAVVERTMSFPARTGRQMTGEVAAKRAGWDGKSPITQVQMFAYQREYNRGATGWKTQGRHVAQLNQIIPYFGVPMTSMREVLRASSRQLGNPKTRIQYGTRMALMFGLTMALRALFEDDEAVKNLSYEEKAKNYPIPIKMDDGSTEVLMIPKAVTEFGVINLFDAAMEAHRSRDPYAWGNMSKALISTYVPNIVPGIFESTARLAFDSKEQNLQQSLIDKLPMGSYEMSANIGVNEEKMLPSQLMRNPYGTTAGIRIGEMTGGAITPRKFDMLADAITSGALQRIEDGLRNLGLVEDLRPASAKSTAGAIPVIGSMFVKRAGVTMRSPSIRTMFTLAEHVNQALMASREQTLGIDAAANAELQYKLQNQAAALRQAWATISAINYIATYYNGEPGYEITTAQRQEMMRYAGAIADEVNAAIYNDYIPTRYDSGKLPMPVGNVPGRSLKEQRMYVEMQQPEYTPVINWPKTLGLPQ